MFLKIFLSSFFLVPIIYCQSYLEKGISEYNQRHLGCVEDQAKPGPISSAIGHFEKALDKKDDKYEASLYLLKSYYFKSKFVIKDKKVKKDLLKKGKDLGLSLVEKFPNSVEYRYWYLVNLGSWAQLPRLTKYQLSLIHI